MFHQLIIVLHYLLSSKKVPDVHVYNIIQKIFDQRHLVLINDRCSKNILCDVTFRNHFDQGGRAISN
jgi:hypothetical protein